MPAETPAEADTEAAAAEEADEEPAPAEPAARPGAPRTASVPLPQKRPAFLR
jgi:hypothetical protein